MKQSRLVNIFLISLVLLILGCGKKASDEIDFGTINGSVYQNDYFGLSISLPPDWNIQDQETTRQVSNQGVKVLRGDDKNLEAVLKASEMTTVFLLAASKHPYGAAVRFNPNISCIAEKVGHVPGIKKGGDFHFHSRKFIESGQMQVNISPKLSDHSLGDIEFNVMDVEIPMAGVKIQQKHYATIMKGYALLFVITFTNDREASELHDILETITFN